MLWKFLWINGVCGGEEGARTAIAFQMQHSARKLSTYSPEPFSSISPMSTVEALESTDFMIRALPVLTGRGEDR